MIPPPVAVTVMVCEPVEAVLATVRVRVDVPEPGEAIEVGLKLAVTPVGKPVAESETAELNPPEPFVVTVVVPVRP